MTFHLFPFRTDLSRKTKKFFFGCCQYQNKKVLFTDSIFNEDFGLVVEIVRYYALFIGRPLFTKFKMSEDKVEVVH